MPKINFSDLDYTFHELVQCLQKLEKVFRVRFSATDELFIKE